MLAYLQAAVPFNAILAYLYLYVDVLSITHRLEKVFCKATEGTLIIDKIEKGTVRGDPASVRADYGPLPKESFSCICSRSKKY